MFPKTRAGDKGSDANAEKATLKLVAAGRQLDALLRILAALGVRPEWAQPAAASSSAASTAGRSTAASAAARRSSIAVSAAASCAPTPGPAATPAGGAFGGGFGDAMATPAPSLMGPPGGGRATGGGDSKGVGGGWVPRNSIVRDALHDLSNYPSTVRSSRQRTRRCTDAGGAPPGTAQW